MTERIMEIICEIKSKVKRMSWAYGMCVCVCACGYWRGKRVERPFSMCQ